MSDGANGWDIPSFDDDHDEHRRDRRECAATLDLVEHELIPQFFDRTADGVPHRWVARMKTNWATLGWNVVASRMVRDYVTAEVARGKFDWEELVVQAVHGPVRSDGSFDHARTTTVPLTPVDDDEDAAVRTFAGTITADGAGSWGVTARVLPYHPDLANIFDTGLATVG
jgi:hypothetical protein